MILHADANSFYASCEQLFRPDLRNKPVIVLSNNDGCAVALSKEAKELGLKRGDYFYNIQRFCEDHDVAVFSSNYTLYAEISSRITSIYKDMAPDVEEYSIDESFLFFRNYKKDREYFVDIAKKIKNRVQKEVGMPICVGGAPSKTLAKLYNKQAKKHGGVYIYDPATVDELLFNTEIKDIWGIGPSRTKKLMREGLKNALDVKHYPLDKACKLLTVVGYQTILDLNGMSGFVQIEREKSKNITTSRQFMKKVYDLKTLECALSCYTESAVEKLRGQGSETSYITVYLSTCNFGFEDDQSLIYSNSIGISLPRPTSYTPDIYKAALEGLRQIYVPGYAYKTVLINLSDLTDYTGQGYLFSDAEKELKNRNLMSAIDKITQEYGRNGIAIAKSFLIDGWQTKRERLSPRFTTNFNELPKVY